MTMARGALTGRFGTRAWVSKRLNSAMRNAAVLPVPVCAWPATSRPGERHRQGLRLNRRAAGKAEFGDAPLQGFGDVRGIECKLTEMGV
jgi:hypothetical protein